MSNYPSPQFTTRPAADNSTFAATTAYADRAAAAWGGLFINATASPYNASTALANNRSNIQAAIDAASAAGGGTVFIPPGIYKLGAGGLKLSSNVTLLGLGGTATCLRPDANANSTGTVMGGVTVYATICSIATDGSKVDGIFLDHSTNSTNGNGIQFGESGASSRTINGVIKNCTVYAKNVQKYLIYSKLADRMQVYDNYCVGDTDGSTPTVTDISGIEIFGADVVEVSGNVVSNCLTGILIKSQSVSDVPNSYIKNARVHDNQAAFCSYGIQVNCESGSDKTHENVIVHSNTIRDCVNSGIRANQASGSIVRGLLIAGNAVLECKGGIEVWSNAGATTESISVADNVIKRSSLGGATPLVLNPGYDVKVSNNTIIASTYYGMFIAGSRNDVSGNKFSGSFTDTAITLQNAASYNNVSNNDISGNGISGAIDLIGACTNNMFIANIFKTIPSAPVIRNDDGLATTNIVRSSVCDFTPTNAHAPPTTMLRAGSDFFVTNLTGSSYVYGAVAAFAGSRVGRITFNGSSWIEM